MVESQPVTLTFSYSGVELAPLLARLLSQHVAELAACNKEIAKFSPGQIAAAKQVPGLGLQLEYDKFGNVRHKQQPPNQNDAAIAIAARDEAWIAKRETELWLLECRRTPSARWLLSLKEIGHLYSEQIAGETLDSFQAKPPAPSSLLGHLIAAIASWFSPQRQPPRLPESTT